MDDQVTVTFWGLLLLLLVYVPLVLIWAATLVDVFRRDDIGGPGKVAWVVAVVVLPVLGTLLYLLLRRPQATVGRRGAVPPPTADDRVRELALLASLHDRGVLDDAVFASESRRVLGTPGPGAVPSQGQAPPLPSRT